MSDYSELKRLAEAATIGDKPASTPIKELIGAQDAFRSECRPEKVLALIAENERLESEAVYSAAGFDAAREEVARLKADNESLRKDAERWQWVREQYWIQEVIDARLGDTPSVTEMEALIDANRSPENPS